MNVYILEKFFTQTNSLCCSKSNISRLLALNINTHKAMTNLILAQKHDMYFL